MISTTYINEEERIIQWRFKFMTITEYIQDKYPIHTKVKELFQNPYTMVANEDNLPYDLIGPDEDGQITKLVMVNTEGRTISVIDLIGLSEEEREADLELKNIYEIYMSQIDYEDVNLSDIMQMTKMYKRLKEESGEAAGVLSL